MVDGRVVVEGGHVTTVDESRLRIRAAEVAEVQRSRNGEAWTLAERLLPHVGVACRAAAARPFPIDRFAGPVTAPASGGRNA
jgi:hypothetical protein